MELGLFCMPVHRPHKPWGQALAEDREAIVLADRLGYTEVWFGEHFTTRTEQVTAPLMLFASVLEQAPRIRFGTGVINLPHHHPVIVAGEAAQFDQLSGGRLMLGVGPGGLVSDAELFGHTDMDERHGIAMEGLDVILRLWREDAPFVHRGQHFALSLQDSVWTSHGVGVMPRPRQQPHPPIAMAMVSPGGRTAETIAERDFIPISANFVPAAVVASQWQTYAARRDALGLPADRGRWRVCRNILVTDDDAHAAELLADPDGDLAFYFRYLRGLRQMGSVAGPEAQGLAALNAHLGVDQALDECVIAGSVETVTARLVELVDDLGDFGHLIAVGHDWDSAGLWRSSMARLAHQVMPRVAAHAATRR